MERNYDEIIADMLIQLDVHTRELTNQSQELTKHSQELTKQSHQSDLLRVELQQKFMMMEKIDNQLTEQMVHSANILERIIKKMTFAYKN